MLKASGIYCICLLVSTRVRDYANIYLVGENVVKTFQNRGIIPPRIGTSHGGLWSFGYHQHRIPPPPHTHTHTLRIGIPDRGLMNFGSDRQRMSPSWPIWTLPLSWRIYKLQIWLAQNMPYPRIGCVGDFLCGDRFIPRGYRLVLLLRWRMCIIAVKSILLLHGCKMYWNIICENGESSTKLDGNPTGRRCRP